eukprot:m.98043 g.98043  ORF g.98043 m.98043 type:complete len:550 (+) comp16736_c0_seq3:162-1811(+)
MLLSGVCVGECLRYCLCCCERANLLSQYYFFRSIACIFVLFFLYRRKPNLLFLFPDQWRFDWDGRHKNFDGAAIPLKIPTIRSLTQQGTLFSNAFVAAPVCAPSRSCLASGREYDRAGVACNFCNDFPVNTEKTFYNQLQDAGYHTMVTGKDDLTKKSQPGIDGEFHRVELGFSDALRASGKMDVVSTFPHPHEPYGVFLNNTEVVLEDGTPVSAWVSHAACMNKGNKSLCDKTSFPGSTYEDNWTAENAITLLKRKPSGVPWFIQVNFPGPHPPFLITDDMMQVEVDNTFTAGIDQKLSNTSFKCMRTGEPDVNDGKTVAARCDYAAEIENIDSLMAKIMGVVTDMGEMDNTITVFASDHGTMLGDHGDTGKTMPWQGSAGVPLIVVGPNVVRGVVRTTPVSIMDLAATFLDYGGGALAPGMTSRSMRALFEGTNTTVREYVHSGLQAGNFGTDEVVPDNEGPFGGGGFNWRMVIKQYDDNTILKFICCKGKCNGQPSTAKSGEKYTQLLYNIVADPFDMNPLTGPAFDNQTNYLRSLLPTSEWTCGQ